MNLDYKKTLITSISKDIKMFPAELVRGQIKRSIKVCMVLLITLCFLYLYSVLNYIYNNFSMVIEVKVSVDNDLENEVGIAMDDHRLIENISSDFLLPPSKHGPLKKYKLEHPELDPSMGQSAVIKRLLLNKRNGFFIECGAFDGETRSNTLSLERFLDWSGLLIEGDPRNFALMAKKNRKAWLSFSCLSTFLFPQIVTIRRSLTVGSESLHKTGADRSGFVDVHCFPLYSYLLALNISHVDYFSLNVGGDELDVLRTIPFEKVEITTLSVEFTHVREGKKALRNFMESKNYSVVAEIIHPAGLGGDFIFLKNRTFK